mmetsp:Transcript_16751/g.50288  ORF Transcript_16751/g.50288 Transcript_16751/m.50288 type:complete len:373 (-) Transcript_16751:311-1429(-)
MRRGHRASARAPERHRLRRRRVDGAGLDGPRVRNQRVDVRRPLQARDGLEPLRSGHPRRDHHADADRLPERERAARHARLQDAEIHPPHAPREGDEGAARREVSPRRPQDDRLDDRLHGVALLGALPHVLHHVHRQCAAHARHRDPLRRQGQQPEGAGRVGRLPGAEVSLERHRGGDREHADLRGGVLGQHLRAGEQALRLSGHLHDNPLRGRFWWLGVGVRRRSCQEDQRGLLDRLVHLHLRHDVWRPQHPDRYLRGRGHAGRPERPHHDHPAGGRRSGVGDQHAEESVHEVRHGRLRNPHGGGVRGHARGRGGLRHARAPGPTRVRGRRPLQAARRRSFRQDRLRGVRHRLHPPEGRGQGGGHRHPDVPE